MATSNHILSKMASQNSRRRCFETGQPGQAVYSTQQFMGQEYDQVNCSLQSNETQFTSPKTRGGLKLCASLAKPASKSAPDKVQNSPRAPFHSFIYRDTQETKPEGLAKKSCYLAFKEKFDSDHKNPDIPTKSSGIGVSFKKDGQVIEHIMSHLSFVRTAHGVYQISYSGTIRYTLQSRSRNQYIRKFVHLEKQKWYHPIIGTSCNLFLV